ncbi:Peptidoglycan/LPS O-acetylase OafA/YrhL, contains acyltransferase and SGNH-hydrolase domains [Lentzea fradiae]|uniref:Peptidoglycan/LPS O-acetylase OafA/YrhL, contains acyltransferase and SGNH-hydrolase domains n=1 Tax=Lentzea fradiae TaxID=200378 RepID=A0A1G7X5S5_9PSEU|nr:acyltransferase family protein [Lentzea fradiae]SDG79493.1 Peptidoglycan/LPS O-acetylase OafA/YrhL, contains acyltransferase and SGNH-hydrolase domains [Lentzea fradiae]
MSTTVESRPEHGSRPDGHGQRKARGFRTDVQALRAIAVLAVVVNHFWPGSLTGGYVGVDVFFVISGFLITSHLDREILRTGRVRLGRFYARRVRRLLPAALLVLALSVVMAYFLLPYPRWTANAWESFSAASYWENWLLAGKSVNYSAQNEAASLVQHYWSLSVEEQFYLFWPLLLMGMFKLGRRRRVMAGVAVLGALSLGLSVHYTIVSPSAAYFITPVRVWEFAIGAGIALAATRLVLPRLAAELAAFTGLALIVATAFVYDHHTPFPGYLALLPAAGTGLVIMSGLRPGRQWHTPVTASRPVQFVGDISYSLYLWHWPVLLLAPFALGGLLEGGKLTTPWLFGLLAVSLVLAWLSKVLVEDRGMAWGPLTRSTRLTFAGMVAGIAVVAVLATGLQWTYGRHVAQAERDVAAGLTSPCHGAGAMIGTNGCPTPFGPARVTAMGPANEYWRLAPECRQIQDYNAGDKHTTSICDFSGGAPARKVWLVGDSHAQQWQSSLFELARASKWQLKLAFLGGCPFADVRTSEFRGKPIASHEADRCANWTRRMTDVIADDRPSLVLTSFFARKEVVEDRARRGQTEQYRAGLEPRWRKWTDAGARVVVLADPPLNSDVRSPDCVTLNPSDPLACAIPRETAHPADPLVEVARTTTVPGVSLVDLSEYFCDPRQCYSVIGNVVVYYDADHVNGEYSRSLAPVVEKALG